jgi:sugar O-acyltransferase (sialic acid O-acetyltransferase NeuD family)
MRLETTLTNPSLLMIGSGGHARVLLEVLEEAGHQLNGVVGEYSPASKLPDRYTFVPDLTVLTEFSKEDYLLINGVGSSSDLSKRDSLFREFKAAGFNFLQLQAQTAHISESATLFEGVQVMHQAVVHSEAVIEDNVIINTGAIVEHHCVVAESAHIAVGAVLCGNVEIGALTHVGANATILQGVRVGSNCIIGAGAVVLHDVPDNSIAVGVPAVVKSRS